VFGSCGNKVFDLLSVCWVRGSGDYDQKKKIQSSVWRVLLLCQFLVLAGNWQFFCCGGKFILRPEKKRYSRLSGGCAIIITTGKKKIQSSVCWVRGSGDYDQKKKDTVICLAGFAVVSVFGSGGKLAVFLLWREIFITTG
jgi:hypothetical protein